jgi:hypothetical protein
MRNGADADGGLRSLAAVAKKQGRAGDEVVIAGGHSLEDCGVTIGHSPIEMWRNNFALGLSPFEIYIKSSQCTMGR